MAGNFIWQAPGGPVPGSMGNGGNGGKRPLYEPFKSVGENDPAVQSLQKSTEEKAYYILYYNIEFEEYKFKKFIGRYDAYFGLRDILEAESVDLEESFVIVETAGYDANKTPKRFLTHPENAANLIEFAHMMEKFFGDNAWSIEEFNTGYTIHQKEEDPVTEPQQQTMTYEQIAVAMGKNKLKVTLKNTPEQPQQEEDIFIQGDEGKVDRSLFMTKEERDAATSFLPTEMNKDITDRTLLQDDIARRYFGV